MPLFYLAKKELHKYSHSFIKAASYTVIGVL